MAPYDFRSPRLFVDRPLSAGMRFEAGGDHASYLLAVMRLGAGDTVLLFNGVDGEWRASLEPHGRRKCVLVVEERTRPQTAAAGLVCCFAPLKRARLDYMVQKAVEMGAGVLQPVITAHTQVARLNLDRMRANAIEAAEQCGILAPPLIRAEIPLDALVEAWPRDRMLVFCDEHSIAPDTVTRLQALAGQPPPGVLIGPEGGFAPRERDLLNRQPFIVPISLGPRILRADTAAVAALAAVQLLAGDWRHGTGD